MYALSIGVVDVLRGWIIPDGFPGPARAAAAGAHSAVGSRMRWTSWSSASKPASVSTRRSFAWPVRFGSAHTDLAHELAVVNRKTNAGIPRDTALRSLWQRTGVEEMRALVSSMIQSEKWGTSIATVLRVSAETLRRKRRQTAEKKAKQAPLKMTFPLVLFILPALFIVIMGPALVQVIMSSGRSGSSEDACRRAKAGTVLTRRMRCVG